LTTPREIFSKKREIQKKLSKIETYKLICETFLKFIPPALLSLIISVIIILPATKVVEISLMDILILAGSVIITFIFCWKLLIIWLDKIYENSTYLEALEARLAEVEGKTPK